MASTMFSFSPSGDSVTDESSHSVLSHADHAGIADHRRPDSGKPVDAAAVPGFVYLGGHNRRSGAALLLWIRASRAIAGQELCRDHSVARCAAALFWSPQMRVKSPPDREALRKDALVKLCRQRNGAHAGCAASGRGWLKNFNEPRLEALS